MIHKFPWERVHGGMPHGAAVVIDIPLFYKLKKCQSDTLRMLGAAYAGIKGSAQMVDVFFDLVTGLPMIVVWDETLPAKAEGERYAIATIEDGHLKLKEDTDG